MNSFSEWLKNKKLVENDYYGRDIYDQNRQATQNMEFSHPLMNRSNTTSNPNMAEIKKYIISSNKQGGDAVTSLRNLGAMALASNRKPNSIQGHDGQPLDKASSRGFRPASWDHTIVLQRMGFEDSSAFADWFNRLGGKEIVAKMQRELQSEF